MDVNLWINMINMKKHETKEMCEETFLNSGPTLTSTDASLSEARVLSSLFAWKLEAWTMWTHVDPRFLTRCPFRVQQAFSEAVGKWQTSKADVTSQENDLLKLIKINKFNDWYLTKLCLFYRQSRRLKSGETELPCASGSALLSPRRHGGSFKKKRNALHDMRKKSEKKVFIVITSLPSRWSNLSCPEPSSITHVFCTDNAKRKHRAFAEITFHSTFYCSILTRLAGLQAHCHRLMVGLILNGMLLMKSSKFYVMIGMNSFFYVGFPKSMQTGRLSSLKSRPLNCQRKS